MPISYCYIYQNVQAKIIDLFICIEAIDIYLFNNTQDKILYQRYCLYRQINKPNIYQIEYLIMNIYFLFNKIQTSYIQELIIDLLYNYSVNINYLPMKQYLKRFQYLRKKNQNYYYNLSYSSIINIQELAIINLYTLYKLGQQKTIHNFIEYLQLSKLKF